MYTVEWKIFGCRNNIFGCSDNRKSSLLLKKVLYPDFSLKSVIVGAVWRNKFQIFILGSIHYKVVPLTKIVLTSRK